MKRRDLIRYLIQNGCELDREGKRHTVYWHPETNRFSMYNRFISLVNSSQQPSA